ncbi:D-alanyl-D-alanine carboxypeptidase family protein [Nonomuraea dietziae]|uniref:D-alanyl-D-alanine carboxypeptidase family protein n=1 Tax=Nonomuraea dietziae TaxID=65515 RepID=UPI0031DFFDF4
MRIGGIRLLTGIAAFALVVGFSPSVQAERDTTPDVGARSAYVVDSKGTVHFGKRETRRVPVASLVKVMTAYVVLRDGDLGDVVTVTKADVRHAADNGATSAALRAGEQVTTRDLLYGLMLPSGADAANALARTYGPGKSAFVAKMNAAARSLGLRDTLYTNADGLPSPRNGGYSTAADQGPGSWGSPSRTRRSAPWSPSGRTGWPRARSTEPTPGPTPTSCSARRTACSG